jgi:acetate kinase
MPVPTADFRVSIASDELRRIQQDVEQRVQQSARVAMQDVWQRLHDRVAHMADKLSDPKAIFRDSLVENAREICAILPRLNFTDDPDLERMRQEVEATLLKHPDALRNDPVLRQDTATQAKRIMDAMGAFMGN